MTKRVFVRGNALALLVCALLLLLPPWNGPASAHVADQPCRSISPSRDAVARQMTAAHAVEPVLHDGGTIALGSTVDIATLHPMLVADSQTLDVVSLMFDPLVKFNPIDGSMVPGLADSWDLAPDCATYTFRLNTHATWHDGVDVSAEDVQFSFDAILDDRLGNPYATTIRRYIESYRVIDPDTFEIVARDGLATFLANGPGAVFIIPKHVWGEIDISRWGDDGGSTGRDPRRVIGSGPFSFVSWEHGRSVTLASYPGHYVATPAIDHVTRLVFPDVPSVLEALRAGVIDIVQFIPASQERSVAESPGLVVAETPLPQMTFYALNLDADITSLFQEESVRQALLLALDREALTERVFFGSGEAAVGIQPPGSPGYAPERMLPDLKYDPAVAERLLRDAGWTDANGDGTLDKDGTAFAFDLLYSGGDPVVDDLVAFLVESWHAVSIEAHPVDVSGTEFLDRLQSHDFAVALLAFAFGFDGDQGLLFECSASLDGFNFMRFCDARYDELQDLQLHEFDLAARRDYLIEQSQIVWQAQPIGPLRFGILRTGYSERLHNFFPSEFDYFWSLPFVWIDCAPSDVNSRDCPSIAAATNVSATSQSAT